MRGVETMQEKQPLWKWVMMHGLFLVYSLTTVISKKIADAEFLSPRFILGYLLIFLCLGIYALGWQQVLKSFSLSKAFANKAVVVIWGLIWGAALFRESITPGKIIGAALIIAGVLFFASEEEHPGAAEKDSQFSLKEEHADEMKKERQNVSGGLRHGE